MAENKRAPERDKGAEKSMERQSGVNSKIQNILEAVRAGTMAVSIATQTLVNMGCGARTELYAPDKQEIVDQGDAGDTHVDAGSGCVGVDAGPGCVGVDAGPGCVGVDAGPGCAGVDAGPGCVGVDAGPGCVGVDAGPGCAGVDAGPGCAGIA